MLKICGSCAVARLTERKPDDPATHECRANPPTAQGWPRVISSDWCGAWRGESESDLPEKQQGNIRETPGNHPVAQERKGKERKGKESREEIEEIYRKYPTKPPTAQGWPRVISSDWCGAWRGER